MTITPKDIAEADQVFASMTKLWPGHWRAMYLAFVEEGFSETQAMELLKAYIQKPHA